jgi:coenzyme F420-reducing hydrogenase alpha subunit
LSGISEELEEVLKAMLAEKVTQLLQMARIGFDRFPSLLGRYMALHPCLCCMHLKKMIKLKRKQKYMKVMWKNLMARFESRSRKKLKQTKMTPPMKSNTLKQQLSKEAKKQMLKQDSRQKRSVPMMITTQMNVGTMLRMSIQEVMNEWVSIPLKLMQSMELKKRLIQHVIQC